MRHGRAAYPGTLVRFSIGLEDPDDLIDDLKQAAVIMAALPTGSSIFVVAEQYGVAPRRVSATIALSTAISVITLSFLFVELGVK